MTPTIHATIAAWQAENREIGMLEFADSGSADERFPYYQLPQDLIFIATDECNAVCIRADGGVCELDCDDEGRVACECAQDQDSFVAALAEMDKHYSRCGTDESYCDDMTAAANVRARCAELAGGAAYTPFFSSLLGV